MAENTLYFSAASATDKKVSKDSSFSSGNDCGRINWSRIWSTSEWSGRGVRSLLVLLCGDSNSLNIGEEIGMWDSKFRTWMRKRIPSDDSTERVSSAIWAVGR